MPASDDTLDILKALVVLRRALRRGPSSGDTQPKLPVAQVQVLLHLAQSGPLMMTELAGQLGVSCPTTTILVDRLVTAGRVERAASPGDRRKVMVQLTAVAQAIADGALAARREKVQGVLQQLTAQERTGFVRGMQMLARAFASSATIWLADFLTAAPEAAMVVASL